MARKSSKTAHVMNLLAGDSSQSPASDAAKENLEASQKTELGGTINELTVLAHQASIQTTDTPFNPSPISIIDMSSSAPDSVAEIIKQQLEEEEKEEQNQKERKTDVSEPMQELQASLSAISPAPDTPIPDQPVSAPSDIEIADSMKSGSQSVKFPDSAVRQKECTDYGSDNMQSSVTVTYKYLNVMEYVVKNKVYEYMEKFDVCPCGRCIADITALALMHLPPKYIVVEPPSASPLLNFYSNRFSQQVTVELTKACSVVKDNPHH
ncbi:MAG: late competence development ComFB family protein [Hungatella sp.]|jgi:competence protein ComFB|nr:late competence development ComFB family protein [Hungatella sp.]